MLRTLLLFILIIPIALLIISTGRVNAQSESGIEVFLTANTNQVVIGQPVTLTVQVKHPTGHNAIIPQLSQKWGELEVRDQSQIPTVVNGDGTEITSQTIEAAIFAIGDFDTPELTITIVNPSGEITRETTPVVTLTVTPTVTETDLQLRGLKPQVELPPQSIVPVILGASLAGVLVLGLLGWGVYLLLKKMYWLPGMTRPFVDTRTPYQIARDDLAHIEKLDLPAQGRYKEHCDMISDTLRAFIERTYNVDLSGVTTYGLNAALVDTALRTDDTRRVVRFLQECDQVKYARIDSEPATVNQSTNRARDLVDLIVPAPALPVGSA